MAIDSYLYIKGTKQGNLKGESLSGVGAGRMRFLGYRFEITSPRDVSTGLSTGKRVHTPLTIIKEWGAASPQLFQALVTNELLSIVSLEFYRTDAGGTQQVYHTITLTNASVSNLKHYMAGPVMAAEYDATDLEEISFTYQKIHVAYTLAKTSAADDWLSS